MFGWFLTDSPHSGGCAFSTHQGRVHHGTSNQGESKALITHRPTEILPRAYKLERWFDRMVVDFWRRPFPTFPLRPERWWPAETGMMMPMPAVDVYEEKDDAIKAEIPGLLKEAIRVQVTDATLTIKGEKTREEEVKEDDYYRSERPLARLHGPWICPRK